MISTADGTLTIRHSREDGSDLAALRRLAELDSAHLPGGLMLMAEVDGELRAAVTSDGSAIIADPFHRTRHLVALLQVSRAAERRYTPSLGWRSRLAHISNVLHPRRRAGIA